MGPDPGAPGWRSGLGALSYGDANFQSKAPGFCPGGRVILVESRRVHERRLRPQAGCYVQLAHFTSTSVNAVAAIRLQD